MAETITIFGKQFPKPMVYVLGAGAVGVVGYAWFTRQPGPSEEEEIELPEPVEEPTDEPGFSVTGDIAQIATNADWTNVAVSRMIAVGHEGAPVSAALGKFLARKPLNKTEASLVRSAVGLTGEPPVGGPWPIIEEDTGGVPPPSETDGKPPSRPRRPLGIKLRKGSKKGNIRATFTWGRADRNEKFEWELLRQPSGRKIDGGSTKAGDRSVTAFELSAFGKRNYTFRVRATNKHGKSGWISRSFNTNRI